MAGQTPGPGRPPGSKNKKTLEWEKLGVHMTGEWADQIVKHGNMLIKENRMEEFFFIYEKMLNYFKPKYASTTIQGEVKIPDLILNVSNPEVQDAIKRLTAPDQEVQDAEVVE